MSEEELDIEGIRRLGAKKELINQFIRFLDQAINLFQKIDPDLNMSEKLIQTEVFLHNAQLTFKALSKLNGPWHPSSDAMKHPKPPVGLRPRDISDEARLDEISEAMKRYSDAGYVIPNEWDRELREIKERLR